MFVYRKKGAAPVPNAVFRLGEEIYRENIEKSFIDVPDTLRQKRTLPDGIEFEFLKVGDVVRITVEMPIAPPVEEKKKEFDNPFQGIFYVVTSSDQSGPARFLLQFNTENELDDVELDTRSILKAPAMFCAKKFLVGDRKIIVDRYSDTEIRFYEDDTHVGWISAGSAIISGYVFDLEWDNFIFNGNEILFYGMREDGICHGKKITLLAEAQGADTVWTNDFSFQKSIYYDDTNDFKEALDEICKTGEITEDYHPQVGMVGTCSQKHANQTGSPAGDLLSITDLVAEADSGLGYTGNLATGASLFRQFRSFATAIQNIAAFSDNSLDLNMLCPDICLDWIEGSYTWTKDMDQFAEFYYTPEFDYRQRPNLFSFQLDTSNSVAPLNSVKNSFKINIPKWETGQTDIRQAGEVSLFTEISGGNFSEGKVETVVGGPSYWGNYKCTDGSGFTEAKWTRIWDIININFENYDRRERIVAYVDAGERSFFFLSDGATSFRERTISPVRKIVWYWDSSLDNPAHSEDGGNCAEATSSTGKFVYKGKKVERKATGVHPLFWNSGKGRISGRLLICDSRSEWSDWRQFESGDQTAPDGLTVGFDDSALAWKFNWWPGVGQMSWCCAVGGSLDEFGGEEKLQKVGARSYNFSGMSYSISLPDIDVPLLHSISPSENSSTTYSTENPGFVGEIDGPFYHEGDNAQGFCLDDTADSGGVLLAAKAGGTWKATFNGIDFTDQMFRLLLEYGITEDDQIIGFGLASNMEGEENG